MKKIILTILSLTIMFSCSTKIVDKEKNADNQNLVLVSDTDLTFQTKKQKIRFLINDNGEIEMLKIYGDTNPQVIHFHDNGYISQLTNKKGKEEENVFYFEPTGQLYKMKSFDSASVNGGDQFLWFANSTSKSLLLDYNLSHAPIISGLKDTFNINTDYILTFKSMERGSFKMKTFDELMELHYDTTFLKIIIDKKKLNEIKIRATKKGIYRIRGKLSETFVEKERGGVMNKLDLNLTFK